MVTAVVSDLHLGARSSVLGTPAARARLLGELERADELVLLGDVLALRNAPLREILDAARPFFDDLGAALAGRRVVIVPGNHDHRLLQDELEAVPLAGDANGLQREWRVDARMSGPLAFLARSLARSEVVMAYPGIWIRDGVYATHGHYLDCHVTVPRIEAVVAHALAAAAGLLPSRRVAARDYEAVLAPMYAFAYARAQSGLEQGPGARATRIARLIKSHGWNELAPNHVSSRRLARVPIVLGAVGAIAALNRAGLGPFSRKISAWEIGRAGVNAMREVVTRLAIDAEYVIFGHTHRAGPLAREGEWMASSGTRLVNTGSWVYEPALIRDGENDAYWPGAVALVDESGPPKLRALLVESASPFA